MIGLPGETDDDVLGIARTIKVNISKLFILLKTHSVFLC